MLPSFVTTSEEWPVHLREQLHHADIGRKLQVLRHWLTVHSRSKPKYMLYMIMYDIENNKVRTQIAKYLIKKGCIRIQKSVYLIKDTKTVINEVSSTLQEVNEAYENKDSILVVPMPQDKFINAKIIGKSITFDVITVTKHVLVF